MFFGVFWDGVKKHRYEKVLKKRIEGTTIYVVLFNDITVFL